MRNIIPKLVYIPVIGLIIGLLLIFIRNKEDDLLNEKNATIKMMFVHIFIPEVVMFLIFVI